jgi:hypothetical protein
MQLYTTRPSSQSVLLTYLGLVYQFEIHGRRIWFGVHIEVNFQFGIGFGKSWIFHSSQQFFGRCSPSVKGFGCHRDKRCEVRKTLAPRKLIPCSPLNLISIVRIYLNRWVETALLNLIGMVNEGLGWVVTLRSMILIYLL